MPNQKYTTTTSEKIELDTCTTPPLIVIFVKLSRTGMRYQEKLLTLSALIDSKKSYLSNSVKGKSPGNDVVMNINIVK